MRNYDCNITGTIRVLKITENALITIYKGNEFTSGGRSIIIIKKGARGKDMNTKGAL